MTDDTLPDAVRKLIGVPQYVEATEFPIEIGYVYNTCAAVENVIAVITGQHVVQPITGQIDRSIAQQHAVFDVIGQCVAH